jgi:hypothetical protein
MWHVSLVVCFVRVSRSCHAALVVKTKSPSTKRVSFLIVPTTLLQRTSFKVSNGMLCVAFELVCELQ